MDKYQMFDAIRTYQNNLRHKQEYGKQHYNKIDNYYSDGRARYFWTKAEWDAYQDGKKQEEWRKQQEAKKKAEEAYKQTDSYKQEQAKQKAAERTTKINEQKGMAEDANKNKLAEMEKGKKQNEIYEKNKAADEARKLEEKKRYDELYRQNNPVGTYAEEEAKREAKEREKWIEAEKKKKEDRKKIDEGLNKIHEKTQENLKYYQGRAEAIEKAREEYARKVSEAAKKIEAEQSKRSAEFKEMAEKNKVSRYLMNDEDSPINKMTDVKDFADGLDEYNPTNEELRDIDQMIQDTYDWIEENRKNEEIDPETGLYIKNYSIPIEDEIKLVNPGYYESNEYTIYSQTHNNRELRDKYREDESLIDNSMNCYACTTAMALREKGYDVVAGSDSDGIMMYGVDEELGMTYDDLWTGEFTDLDYSENTKKKINKEPPGSYGDFNLEIYYKNGDAIVHSIFYKVDDSGKVHYYDCQNGEEYSEQYLKELGNGVMKDFYGKPAYYTRYKRLDNQEFKGNSNMQIEKKIATNIAKKGDK